MLSDGFDQGLVAFLRSLKSIDDERWVDLIGGDLNDGLRFELLNRTGYGPDRSASSHETKVGRRRHFAGIEGRFLRKVAGRQLRFGQAKK
jgi:hypothetical protein